MEIWVDAQLSPAIASWLRDTHGLDAKAVRDLGLRDAEDRDIFDSAKAAKAAVLTKDSDFVDLVERFGPPPQILWLTCGNTSNSHLREILTAALPEAMRLLQAGEPIVEISDIRL
jgi:predicted nuclease of predicted toxin-antitoxin system